MELDDEVCLCFHVTKRKILNYLRIERPRRAAQLSECFGAGTGCGWCRATLSRYFDEAQGACAAGSDVSREQYAQERGAYLRAGKGTPPPGATPPPEG